MGELHCHLPGTVDSARAVSLNFSVGDPYSMGITLWRMLAISTSDYYPSILYLMFYLKQFKQRHWKKKNPTWTEMLAQDLAYTRAEPSHTYSHDLDEDI